MKSTRYFQNTFYSSYNLFLKSIFIGALFFISSKSALYAQEGKFIRSPWWIGVAGGVNFNLYHGGSPHELNSDITVSKAFQSGSGNGVFGSPVLEYHRPDTKLGFILQAGYESKRGTFENELTAKLAYITVEPSIRLNLFNSPLYLFAGPRLGISVDKRFNYQPNTNSASEFGLFSNMKKSVISMQFGGGYDIPLTAKNKKNTQVILAPFVAFHPYFGQSPRTTDSWNMTTIRAGIALKFGRARQIAEPNQIAVPVVIAPKNESGFLVNGPADNSVKDTDSKISPLRNDVYFDLRSSDITKPYNKPDKRQIKTLKKQMIGFSENENISDSLLRQTIVKDNFLNILGEQMANYPSSEIILIGSSENGDKYGQQLAESVKLFLVEVFGIDKARIHTKGKIKLKIHTGQRSDKFDLGLLLEGNRQVLIKSNSESLQKEFRGGSTGPLKPLEMKVVHEPNMDGYITFKTAGTDEGFSFWSLKITDDSGKTQNFGSYTEESVAIPKKSILGTNTFGQYQMSMVVQLNSGNIVKKDTIVNLRVWPLIAPGKFMRFSILYEFNNSKTISIFKQYLTDVVVPKIPKKAKVVIHGHSDFIKDSDYDLKLFLSRANDTRSIIENALAKVGRTDVQFEVYGLGNDQIVAPFEKKNPDEGFLDRTLIIDIVPEK